MKSYKVCPVCSKKFTKNYFYSQNYWKKQIYCSLKCSGTLFRKTGHYGKCDFCSKKIWILLCKDKHNKTGKHFCSINCRNKILGKLKIGYHHTEEAKQKIREKRALQKPIPKEAYAKRKLSGKNHWNWKGGISKSPGFLYGKDWHDIRIAVYKRDNFTCQKCGIKCSGKPGKDLIQCHHKNAWRKSKNNNMSNLITLCLSCHIKEDFKYDKELRDINKSGEF